MAAGRSKSEQLADANLIESIREHARWQAPVELTEHRGLLLLAGRSDYPGAYRNAAVRLDSGLSAEEALARAREFFGGRGRGFTLWVRTGVDDDLETLAVEAGLNRVADGPCMLVEAPLDEVRDLPEGIHIQRFADAQHVRDAIAVNAEAYAMLGLPAEETRASFPDPARLLSPRIIGFVAYDAAGPVSTALTLIDGAHAGIYWVGTVARAQRLGLGGLCTRLATNAAFERQARVVMLQASPFGAAVYERLGFETYGRARWYRAAVKPIA